MGDPIGRVPGPLGTHVGGGLSDVIDTVTALLRDPRIVSMDEPAESWTATVSLLDPARLSDALRDIYGSENWPSDDTAPGGGNIMDPPNARLPSARRERDARRPTKPLAIRLTDPHWSIDTQGLRLTGQVSGTVVIPTPYGPDFDSPTPIKLTLTSAQLGAKDLTLGGSASAYKVIRADWKLQLHYDARALLEVATSAAKQHKIGKAALEQMLREVSFDASAVIKAGIPLSWVQVSASSLLPSRRPLLGALDRLLPVQIAAMPDSRLLMVGGVLLPRGVVFDTIVPGIGLHFSQYGTRRGGSVTLGGVTYPRLTELGAVGVPTSKAALGRVFPIFGYVDLRYAQRISNTVDLGVGLTYAYSPSSGGPDEPDRQELHYLEAKYQPWLPASQENIAPAEATSKHRFMFRIEGTHDLLGR